MYTQTLPVLFTIYSVSSYTQAIDDCQLLIAAGSTAAFGLVITASKFLNKGVCLLEPTDWVGGQLTVELLSAPDFAWHRLRDGNFTLHVGANNRQPENRNPLFTQMLHVLGDTGHCMYLHGALFLNSFMIK